MREASQAPTTHLFAPGHLQTAAESHPQFQEVATQIEQLRNDLFSAATNISALNDRLERLESRPAGSPGQQGEVAALRADFERWISHHMEAAVEQCMRRVWERQRTPTAPMQA